jgi:hypothetical protein
VLLVPHSIMANHFAPLVLAQRQKTAQAALKATTTISVRTFAHNVVVTAQPAQSLISVTSARVVLSCSEILRYMVWSKLA